MDGVCQKATAGDVSSMCCIPSMSPGKVHVSRHVTAMLSYSDNKYIFNDTSRHLAGHTTTADNGLQVKCQLACDNQNIIFVSASNPHPKIPKNTRAREG